LRSVTISALTNQAGAAADVAGGAGTRVCRDCRDCWADAAVAMSKVAAKASDLDMCLNRGLKFEGAEYG
jgi:hypothetical protein